MNEYIIKTLLDEYELPLVVQKPLWYGDFFFEIEEITQFGYVKGKRYKDGLYYDDYMCRSNETVCLYGNNTKKICENPNGLVVDKNYYVKGITKLFVQKGSGIVPALFDRFEVKNGTDVMYVTIDGEQKFYFFPKTKYVFKNRDDAYESIASMSRVEVPGKITNAFLNAYNKMPKARVPLSSKSDEFQVEYDYHRKLNEKLLTDLETPKNQLDNSQHDILDAKAKYREACIESRSNGNKLDDHTMISYQLRTSEAESLILDAKNQIFELEKIRSKPYFARVDCGVDIDNMHTAYIGEKDIPGYVVDWRHPEIGNAYYMTDIIHARDDMMVGLKRIFDIDCARFLDYNDEVNQYNPNAILDIDYSSSTDELLLHLLKEGRADKKTHNIIKTIQSDQYRIVTSDFSRNAVVNGCAGSGKTVIMYHRLSFMAYNYKRFTGKELNPNNIYVVSPSKYFDFSSDDLLKKLSLEKIQQASLKAHFNNLIKKYCDKYAIVPIYGITSLVDNNINNNCDFYSNDMFIDFYQQVKRIDSEKKLKEEYRRWICKLINDLLEENDFEKIVFDNILNAPIDTWSLLRSPKYYFNDCFLRNENLENEKLYFNRDIITGISFENILCALDEANKQSGSYKQRVRKLNKYREVLECCLSSKIAMTPTGRISSDLKGFWSLFEKTVIFEKLLYLIVVEKLLDCLNNNNSDIDFMLKCIYVYSTSVSHNYLEDMYSYYLAALSMKFGPIISDDSYIFVDEFQNYSLFELKCLKDAFEVPVFNFYGDYDQRIDDKGKYLRNDLKTIIPHNEYIINVNYRNARPITEYINKNVHKNMGSIGIDGNVSECNIQTCNFELKDRTVIIAKNTSLAYGVLKSYIDVKLINYLTITQEIDENMISLVDIKDSKGLEFDTVYVFDFDMNENEKYVAYTRAMENLIIIKDDLILLKKEIDENKIREKAARAEAKKKKKILNNLARVLLLISENMPQKKDEICKTIVEPPNEAGDQGVVNDLTEDFKGDIYWKAIQKFTSDNVGELQEAIALLESINSWKDSLDKIEAFKEKIAILVRKQEEEKKEEYRNRKACQYCGGKFKGIFSRVCRDCGKPKDY